MSKLDVYLRSIEKFGASGAVLTSGQPVLMRFPTGDRHATQVTPHDQLVILVREVAPPAALDQIDAQRPARFEVDSQGIRYTLSVQARPGAWQVAIDPAAAAPPPRAATAPVTRASAPDLGNDMLIERGQYDGGAASVTTASGSTFLDQLTTQARGSRATDIYLAAGSPPLLRAGGQLAAASDRQTDADLLSRELGIVAPAEARAAWTDRGAATFAYSDGAGRIRATLGRDENGPRASLRLLHGEGPPLERLGLGAAAEWLEDRGLIVIAGPSGAGKTTTLAALVRALGDRRKVVVTLEDPIEILHAAPSISQRAVGNHVASFRTGVGFAMREGADAIVIGTVTSRDAATAVIDAVAGGHLVLATLAAPTARVAIEHMLERLPDGQRETARALCTDHLLGTVTPVVAKNGNRSFEVSGRGSGS